MKNALKELKDKFSSLAQEGKKTSIFKTAYGYYRQGQQAVEIYKNIKAEDAIVMSANTVLNVSKIDDIRDKALVFMQVEAGEYDFVIWHKNHTLHKNRKLIWASFEVSGLAISPYVSKKLGLNIGKDGMFSYVGGGRASKGLYRSGTSINIYKNISFLIVNFHTAYNENLEIQEIGLIKKDAQEKPNAASNINLPISHNFINCQNLINKINDIVDCNTYLIYANISPNVADGSSIWMSSITDIVATNQKVILLLKENLRSDIIVSNIVNKENLIIIQPSDYSNLTQINEKQALEVIRSIDSIHPRLRGVLVRGIVAANELVSDRVFKYRTISYLTDFYEVADGKFFISDERERLVKNIALHSHLMLIQTAEIREKLFSLLGYQHPNFAYLPPSLPDAMFNSVDINNAKIDNNGDIKIGYAGKIMPNWGVEELLSWVIEFNKRNERKIKLFIAANKISAPGDQRKPFAGKIKRLIEESKAEHYTTLNREQCIKLLKGMDYVWAYRPGYFENATLELSTKLLEATAMGQRVICYPSKIHVDELGSDYPFYAENKDDFYNLILKNQSFDMNNLVQDLKEKHSISHVAQRLLSYQPFDTQNDTKISDLICFAGHDFKFVDPYISYLKSNGFNVVRDVWEWGSAKDLEISKKNYDTSQIIFCEWGLANAVWFSNNNTQNKPLYIRVHAQEVRDKAKKFGKQINFNRVTKVIFVSRRVREEYIKLFGIPREKTIFIPNFVEDDEFLLRSQKIGQAQEIVLGMVGIVPQLKRLDRAVRILQNLTLQGINVKLRIKGHRPEDLEFMKAPGRIKELDYYSEIYKYIDINNLKDRVIFDGWGNDVALWYKSIDIILSLSDTESFHYALADGVLSGCLPVVWNWSEAKVIYPKNWIVSSEEEAAQRIISLIKEGFNSNTVIRNRQHIVDGFGKEKVFKQLNYLLVNSQSEV